MSLWETKKTGSLTETNQRSLARAVSVAAFNPLSSLMSCAGVTESLLRQDAVAGVRSATKLEEIKWYGGAPLDGVTFRLTGSDLTVELKKSVDKLPYFGSGISETEVRLIRGENASNVIFRGLKAKILFAIVERVAAERLAAEKPARNSN